MKPFNLENITKDILAVGLGCAAAVSFMYSCEAHSQTEPSVVVTDTVEIGDPFTKVFVDSLETLIDPSIVYDPTYRRLDNMCDDVPADVGVCSDVVVRAFLKLDICLAEEIYNYRRNQGLPTDRHIDHRRVRNIGDFLESEGMRIPQTNDRYNRDYYKPGDIIWWKINGVDHIGIVTKNGKVLHNIGQGQVANVTPFAYQVHKVYRPTFWGGACPD